MLSAAAGGEGWGVVGGADCWGKTLFIVNEGETLRYSWNLKSVTAWIYNSVCLFNRALWQLESNLFAVYAFC